jgi:hypothetical protein
LVLLRRILPFLAVCAVVLGAASSDRVCLAACEPVATDAPRTLVLALDGVPLRSVVKARETGSYASFSEPRAMVSTFPSVTNVAFTAILAPFGVAPAGGYEVAHFDLEENKVVGSTPFGYEDRLFAWRDAFDVTSRTVGSKFKTYTVPKRVSLDAVAKAEQVLYDEPDKELILAHVGAADAMIHLRGDKAILKLLIELDGRIQEIKERHQKTFGRPLRVIMLSDHGNSAIKIHRAKGIHKVLRKAGLEVVKGLGDEKGQVVAPTFGIVGYGALFMHQEDADTAGRAVVDNPRVDLAAWLSNPKEMFVVSDAGLAVVHWRQALEDGWRLSYVPIDGDPLEYESVVKRLQASGQLDRDGFAHEDDWFLETVSSEYPDGLRRLIHSLTGTFVDNYATVVLSLKPGFGWGWKSAHLSSKISGGRLEGTHGGLDYDSTVGFFMTDDPGFQPATAVRAEQVLAPFAGMNDCLVVADDGEHEDGHGHSPGM